jgi:hypothetical protein
MNDYIDYVYEDLEMLSESQLEQAMIDLSEDIDSDMPLVGTRDYHMVEARLIENKRMYAKVIELRDEYG